MTDDPSVTRTDRDRLPTDRDRSDPEPPERHQPEFVHVHVALARIVGELPAIGKSDAGQFSALKIDDIVAELKTLQARHGVIVLPRVLDRVPEDRPTRGGGVMHTVHLHVEFTFVGPDGSTLTASAWGEGSDAGDKATPKSMTGAYKSVLRQVLAIADSAGSDPDFGRQPEETVDWYAAHGWADEEEHRTARDALLEELRGEPDDRRSAMRDWMKDNGISLGKANDPETLARIRVELDRLRSVPPDGVDPETGEVRDEPKRDRLEDLRAKVAENVAAMKPDVVRGHLRKNGIDADLIDDETARRKLTDYLVGSESRG